MPMNPGCSGCDLRARGLHFAMPMTRRPRTKKAEGTDVVYRSKFGSPCRRWVKSGHFCMSDRCPLYPQKRTSRDTVGMSALCQNETKEVLLDHLVSACH